LTILNGTTIGVPDQPAIIKVITSIPVSTGYQPYLPAGTYVLVLLVQQYAYRVLTGRINQLVGPFGNNDIRFDNC
jgi:hypothetical protein